MRRIFSLVTGLPAESGLFTVMASEQQAEARKPPKLKPATPQEAAAFFNRGR